MRAALLFCFAAAGAVACGGPEFGTTTITNAPTITSGPAVGERELSRTLSATSLRLATAVCNHESHCGRAEASCMNAEVQRAQQELESWKCDPAGTRARLEECLAGIVDVACDVDVRKDRLSFCPENAACADKAAHLIPPGRELAKIWR